MIIFSTFYQVAGAHIALPLIMIPINISSTVGGIKKTRAITACECKAQGDPHFTTCDKKRYDYMGKCTYITAETCGSEGPKFRVEQKNVPFRWNPRAATTETLYVTFLKDDGTTVEDVS